MLDKLLSQFRDNNNSGNNNTDDGNDGDDRSNNDNNTYGTSDGGDGDGVGNIGSNNITMNIRSTGNNNATTAPTSSRRGSLLLMQEINIQQQHHHHPLFYTLSSTTTPSASVNDAGIVSSSPSNNDATDNNNNIITSPRSSPHILSPSSYYDYSQHHHPHQNHSLHIHQTLPQQSDTTAAAVTDVTTNNADSVIGGGVLLVDGSTLLTGPSSASKRRLARELLPISGMRSRRSIIDPRSLSVENDNTTTGGATSTSTTPVIGILPLLLPSLMMDTHHNNHSSNWSDDHDDDDRYIDDHDNMNLQQDYDFNDVYNDHHDHSGHDDGRMIQQQQQNHHHHHQLLHETESTSLLLLPQQGPSSVISYYGTATTSVPTSSSDVDGSGDKDNVDTNSNRRRTGAEGATSEVYGTTTTTATTMKRPSMKHSGHPMAATTATTTTATIRRVIGTIIQQLSAVAVIGVLNMMIAIPFGASYFPVEWKSVEEVVMPGNDIGSSTATTSPNDDNTNIDGSNNGTVFPLPGKEALGLRMFLFATAMGQLVLTYQSKFVNPIGLQMVENVPFLHALAYIVFTRQGYGPDALSTLFFLFGTSSIVVGVVFYMLGKFQLGKVVYFFPNHVLVGCIGGIGVFILFTAMEVTTNVPFQLTLDGIEELIQHWYLLWVVLALELSLRILVWLTQDELGRPKFQLLTPIYYISITPIFYMGLWIMNIPIDDARDMGYFFPSTTNSGSTPSSSSPWTDPHLFDIFHIVQFSTIDWMAVLECTGTVIALVAFSLIHVPINIPAFAISTDVESDMNAELIAHGWSNGLSGVFGGLQNYMTYSNSVLYAKTGGTGKVSSLGIVLVTAILFVVGPSICDYLPRCMAGTLLLHIGIDLVLEGVYDSFGQYDHLEYAGIWLITIVMTVWGMTAALIAGVISALSTYAVQSINYHNPIRQILSASTLRSSAWARCARARAILDDDRTGRGRILVFQLQGHLFFGNIAQLTDTIKEVLKEKRREGDPPLVVILDFTLVVGMDSSAAHAVAKLKKILHRLFHVEVSIFVTGSDRGGFPCEYALTEALRGPPPTMGAVQPPPSSQSQSTSTKQGQQQQQEHPTGGSSTNAVTSTGYMEVASHGPTTVTMKAADGRVCESLDDALTFAEDILIARIDATLRSSSTREIDPLLDAPRLGGPGVGVMNNTMSVDEEISLATRYLRELFLDDASEELVTRGLQSIVCRMVREEYIFDDVLWEQGSDSDSLKILVCGELLSVIEETGASETVARGNMVGELGCVQGTKRLTTLICSSPHGAVLYSLPIESWRQLKREDAQVASLIDGIAIRYLAHRVQHVSNRYFHTTLPV